MARPRPVAPGDLLTIAEVAEITRYSRAAVYRWIADGQLDRVELGAKKADARITRSSLDAFIARKTIPGRKVA